MDSFATIISNPDLVTSAASPDYELVWVDGESVITGIVSHIVSGHWSPTMDIETLGLKPCEHSDYTGYVVPKMDLQFGCTKIVGFSSRTGEEFYFSTPLKFTRNLIAGTKPRKEFVYIWSIPRHLAKDLIIKRVEKNTYDLIVKYHLFNRFNFFNRKQAGIYDPELSLPEKSSGLIQESHESVKLFQLGVEYFNLKTDSEIIQLRTDSRVPCRDIIGSKHVIFWASDMEQIRVPEAKTISKTTSVAIVNITAPHIWKEEMCSLFFRVMQNVVCRI
jgi:hypothetical protein